MLLPLQHTHLNTAEAIIKKVVANMQQNGIDQWDALYPTREHLLKDIENGHAYGFFVDEVLTAYVALNELYDMEYNDIRWQTQPPFLVVHRLSVAPEFQGQGIGMRCMAAIEQFALQKGYASVRLDTFTGNPLANKLYQRLGYADRGTVTFRKGLFYCYEKALK